MTDADAPTTTTASTTASTAGNSTAPIASAIPAGSGAAPKPVIVVSVIDQHLHAFFNQDLLARLRDLGDLRFDPDPRNHASADSLQVLKQANIIITCWETGSFDAILPQLSELQLLVHAGGTVRAIVGPQVFDQGVRVSAQTNVNAEPVAEYTLAMIILAAKDVFASRRKYRELRDKPADFWDEFADTGFYGTTVGLIGMSRISRHLLKLLKPFNLTVKMQSGHMSEAVANQLGVIPASIEEIMQTCDVVSLHSAWTPRTQGMLKAEHFAMMKEGATFINTARGAICDQDALIAELQRDRIRAIIDVTYPEVNVKDSPLYDLPNVFLTPHAAGSMGRELYRLGAGVVNDIEHFLAGSPVPGEFTKPEYAGRA